MHRSLITLILVSPALFAGEPDAFQPVAPPAAPSSWKLGMNLGYSHQSTTDIDGGGEFSVDHIDAGISLTKTISPGRSYGFSLGYTHSEYDFSFFDLDVHSLSLSAPITWALNDRWVLFGMPLVRSQYESGADASDAVTAGFLAGASYRVNDRLSIGPGIGFSSELEDSASVFPFILIKWSITDTLVLQTGSGSAGARGPGLSLDWKASDAWSFSLGARYEKLRFRLDDKGLLPDGIGEEEGTPVYLAATYHFSETNALTVYGGVKIGGSLTVENSSGNKIADVDYDSTPVFGIAWKMQF